MPACLVVITFLQQSNSFIAESIEELEIKLKWKPDIITKKRNALRDDYRTITETLANRVFVMKSKINHLERFRPTSRSEMTLPKEFANNMATLRQDVNQLMKTRRETETKVQVRITKVSDLVKRVKAYMATLPVQIHTSNTNGLFQKSKTIKVSRIVKQAVEDKTLIKEDQDRFKDESYFKSSNSKKENNW